MPTGPQHHEPVARRIGHVVHSLFARMGGESDQLDLTPQPLPADAFVVKLSHNNIDELALKNDPYAYRDGVFMPAQTESDPSDST